MLVGANDIIFTKPDRVVQPLNWVEHIPFVFKLVEILKPKLIVELGVHSGNSFCAFNQALKFLNIPSKCYGVDNWTGDMQAGFYELDVYLNLLDFINENYKQTGVLMKCSFDQSFDHFQDGSIDILHLDGLHHYDFVSNDFYKWKRKLSDKGIVLFHDTQVVFEGYGVKKFWSEVSTMFPNFEFTHGHGLGVLLCGTNPTEGVKDFLVYLHKNPKYVSLLQLLGSQIFHSNKTIILENNVETLLKLIGQYEKSFSYNLGKMLLSPFGSLKRKK
jgi:hypothetical protein